LTLARGDHRVAISDNTIRVILHEFESSESGQKLSDRITSWDREEPLELTDEEHELIQIAADLALKKKQPAAVDDELRSLRLLRD